MLIQVLLCFLAVLVYVFVVTPLYPMIKLKMQFGQDCKMSYHFFGGEIWKRLQDMKIYRDFFKREREQFKKEPYKIYISNFLWKIRIQIADPDYYKVMLHNHYYYEKVNNIEDDNLIKKGLLFETKDRWKAQRNLLGGLFEFEQLRSRLPMINQVGFEIIAKIHEYNNVLEQLQLITGLVVIKSFFGSSVEGLKINDKDIQIATVELLNDMGELRFESKYVYVKRLLLGTKAWNFFPTIREKTIQIRVKQIRLEIENIIRNKLIILQQSTKQTEENQKYDYFLDILLKDYIKNDQQKSENQAIDEILQQFVTLLFAGTDTTAILCYHCLYYFAMNPQAQKEIRDEVLSICTDEYILDDKLKKLNKLQAFISEVLRLRNPVAKLLMRNCNQTHYIKDLKIQKNWNVVINHQVQSNSETNFPNPDDFNYQRWLKPGPIQINHNFVYIPFSAGPRNCIGQHMASMEAKIILSQILKQFIILPNEQVVPQWNLRFTYQLQPNNCIKLKKITDQKQ